MWIAHTEDTSSGRSCEWMTGLRSIHHRKITLVFTDLHGLHIQVYPVPCKYLQKHWLDEVIWSKVILVPESSAGTRVRKMGKCLTQYHLLDTGVCLQPAPIHVQFSTHHTALLFFIYGTSPCSHESDGQSWHFSLPTDLLNRDICHSADCQPFPQETDPKLMRQNESCLY